MYKNFNLTESEREQILNSHKSHGYRKPLNEQETQIDEYSEGFMNRIVDKFKQQASSQVEMYVKRFKEISSNLENKDITQYSWDGLKDVVDSYMNKDDREYSKGLDKHIDQEVERAYGDSSDGGKKGYEEFLRNQQMDRTSDWKDRLNEQVQTNPQDEIKRLNMEIQKLKKQIALNNAELKKRAELDSRVQQLAKGPKKSMEEQSRFPKTEKHQLWDFYLQAFGVSSMKHIKMKDGDYSLNWGSHSGSGFDWGMSIAKRGHFAFQTTNKEKKAIVQGLMSQFNIPFKPHDYQGTFSVHSDANQNIYDVSEDNMYGFIKKILGNFR